MCTHVLSSVVQIFQGYFLHYGQAVSFPAVMDVFTVKITRFNWKCCVYRENIQIVNKEENIFLSAMNKKFLTK